MSLLRTSVICVAAGVMLSSGSPVHAESERGPQRESGAAITWQPTERWKSLGSYAFRLREFPQDTFILVFPEWVTSREKNWHVRPKWKTDGHRAEAAWESGPYAWQMTMRYDQKENTRTLHWESRFTNGSREPLTDVAAFHCFNLVEAPTFIDLKMDRTWVGSGDPKSRIPLSQVRRVKGPRTIQFYPARGGLPLPEFERFARYQATSDHSLQGDRIGLTSRDGNWQIESIVAGQVAYFFNNWESDHGCIHAAPLYGDIAAGKSGTVRGRIVFTRLKAEAR